MSRVSADAGRVMAVLLLGALAGCGGSYKGIPEGSYERGLAQYEDERWFEATEDLRLFIRRSPTDERAPEAQYMIAMARYRDEDYPVAAVEFEILHNDYPTSPRADDAWYMQGMCYVEQVPRVDLDQTTTRQAVQHFERYLKEYPGGTHREEVQEELRKLHLHLDRKELASARLYRRLKRWDAAAVTIDAMLRTRPDSELRPEMLLLAGEVHARRLATEAAIQAYQEFLRDFPDHPRSDQVRRQLARLEGGPGGEDTGEPGEGR